MANTKVETLRGEEVNYRAEVRRMQNKALAREGCVVRLGPIVFFSTETGDAWMLDPEAGAAICLARDGESRAVQIRENAADLEVGWQDNYRILGDLFMVTEPSGASLMITGYPTKEIQQLIREYPSPGAEAACDRAAARGQRRAGRNDPCPCGSGKKYKKCCLAKDEALAREAAQGAEVETAQGAEVRPAANPSASGGEWDEYEAADGAPAEWDGLGAVEEIGKKVAGLMREFEEREHPTADHLNAYVDELLGLAPEDTEWNRVLEAVGKRLPSELPNAFRRMAARLPRTKKAGVTFLYWTALEQFDQHSCRQHMPEVVDELLKLDVENYDADALHHVETYLLADGFDGEVLRLAGHFLPIMRQDGGLMAYAAPEWAMLLFEIRTGRLLLGDLDPGLEPREVVSRLCEGVSEDVDLEVAKYLAATALEKGPRPPLKREDFGLVTKDTVDDARAREDACRCCGALLRVAEEGYREEGVSPGCSFPALMGLAAAAHRWLASGKRKKNSNGNLLDFLDPVGLEARIARSSQDIIGTDPPKARLLIQAHRLLLHSVMRCKLIAPDKAAAVEGELDRMGAELGKNAALGI